MSRHRGLTVRQSLRRHEEEPLALLVNLFECGIVLALGIALLVRSDAASSQGSGAQVPEQRQDLPRYTVGDGASRGEGTRLGVAYQLQNGEVVFVRDGASAK